ncbi:hypothetical protein F5884DRAFT_869032 [Xylogone sp. PMI_703]|nr:hypothetical protein F5884DRAFT_870365 [Xylogone sp. PMI_703]KAH8799309.1 hypothetical protein F5884DRAFT_869032 [Xylogone sp. PMI_703]
MSYSRHSRSSSPSCRVRYLCALCEKPRSSKFHSRNPYVPGAIPAPGICSRPKCAKVKKALQQERASQAIVQVLEIHHHYHYGTGAGYEGNNSVYVAQSDNQINWGQKGGSDTYDTAELPAESSPTSPTEAELPGYPYHME